MFEITPSASSTDVIENDNVFQACFTDPNQGTASAQYIGENNLATKVAVIYDSSDVYSSGIEATFVKKQQIRDLRLSQRKLSQQIPRQTSPHSYRKHRVKALIWYSFQSTTQRLPSF